MEFFGHFCEENDVSCPMVVHIYCWKTKIFATFKNLIAPRKPDELGKEF